MKRNFIWILQRTLQILENSGFRKQVALKLPKCLRSKIEFWTLKAEVWKVSLCVISCEKHIPARAVWAVRDERHASPCCAPSERPRGLSLPSHPCSRQNVQGKPDKRVGKSERDREQRLNIVHISVLYTSGKPWAGEQTPLLCCRAVWGATGAPRSGTWPCLPAAVVIASRTATGGSPEPLFC